MSEKRPPWMKWYPSDWRADPKLRLCGMASRGVWIEMLGFMHEAEPYGHLIVAGIVPTDQQLAGLIGTTVATVRKAIAELEAGGVFSRNEHGVIYSRRMVRDRDRADEGREWVEKRWAKRTPNRSDGTNPNRSPITQKPEARSQKPEPSLRSGRAREKTAIPADWILSEKGREYARSKGWTDEQISAEAEAFKDRNLKTDTRYADWEAAWRTWVQNAPKFAGNSRGNGHVDGTGPATAIARGFAEALAERRAEREREQDRGDDRGADGNVLGRG